MGQGKSSTAERHRLREKAIEAFAGLVHPDANDTSGLLQETEKRLQRFFHALSLDGTSIQQEVFWGKVAPSLARFGLDLTDKLFKLLINGEATMDFDSFLIAAYLLSKASRKDDKLKCVFRIFDASGSGYVKKSEFKAAYFMVMRGNEYGGAEGPDEAELKPLAKCIVDSAMLIYDGNQRGKISFDEWCHFAATDRGVQSLIAAMSAGSFDV